MSHFTDRCVDRGITANHAVLEQELRTAISKENTGIYRFRCSDGVFYAVANLSTGILVTLFTQKMLRGKKFSRKKRKYEQRKAT